jgi:ATP-dependent 26S proteasome regulatory subunit
VLTAVAPAPPALALPPGSLQVSQEGKYVVECDKDIDIASLQPNARVALRNDSYALHRVLPTKVDPLVSLMKVEKVPDASYDMVGGLDKQVRRKLRKARGAARVCVCACRAGETKPAP